MEELKTHSVISLVDPGKGKDKGDDDGEHQVASLYLSLPIPTFLPIPVKPSCKCNPSLLLPPPSMSSLLDPDIAAASTDGVGKILLTYFCPTHVSWCHSLQNGLLT